MSEIIEFLPATSVIPAMTHHLSKAWDQPNRADIEISDEFARMRPETLKKLADYSDSRPSGVYEGKMWRTCYGNIWYLNWFGVSNIPDMCSVNSRKVSLDFL